MAGSNIRQPVLQWGTSPAGGGNSWGIASWSCGPQCVHSKLVAVNAGDSITGPSTKGDTKAYTWMQAGVLEAYKVSGQYRAPPRCSASRACFRPRPTASANAGCRTFL